MLTDDDDLPSPAARLRRAAHTVREVNYEKGTKRISQDAQHRPRTHSGGLAEFPSVRFGCSAPLRPYRNAAAAEIQRSYEGSKVISSASDDTEISSVCLKLAGPPQVACPSGSWATWIGCNHEPIRAFPGELDKIDNLHIEVQVGVMRMCVCSPKHITGRLAFRKDIGPTI